MTGRTGPDRLTVIIIGGIAIVITGIIALVVLGGGGDDQATPTTTPTEDPFTGDGTPPGGSEVTAAPVPEPYKSLQVAPATGCGSGCLDPMTYSLATPDGRREVAVPEGGPVHVTVTITNPTSFEGVITSAEVSDSSSFALQVPETGKTACPGVGDAPLRIAARGDTTCEMSFKYGTSANRTLHMDVRYAYLVVDESGVLDEREGQIDRNALSTLEIQGV